MRKHIPNIITCCNLLSGCIAIVLALYGSLWAFAFIILGAIFDFFDGMTARLLHVQSPMGVELDSLADVVTFGVAPSAMLYTYIRMFTTGSNIFFIHTILPFAAFILAAFSALRLAKFNIDTRQTTSFLGLPTPANAMFWASLIVGVGDKLLTFPYALYIILLLILCCSWLLVSEIPMFALKFKQWKWEGNEVKFVFLLSCVPLLIVFHTAGIAVIIAWYLLLSIILNCLKQNQS